MVGSRLREYRKHKKIMAKTIASLIGISQGSLSDIENGKTKPSSDTLASIVRHTDINPAWLLTGEGPMMRGEIKEELDGVSKLILESMRDMDEEGRRDVLKYLQERKLIAELLEERKGRKAS